MRRLVTLLGVLCALSGCAKGGPEKGATKNYVNPAVQGATQIRNLADLQTHHSSHVLSPLPWVGFWWPYVQQGIASGWRDPKKLGATDKYDVAYRAYLKEKGENPENHQPATSWERVFHGPGLVDVASWWGHCNGWAAAALMIPEPREAITLYGVTFEVRDLKALFSEAWMEFTGDFVGGRVHNEGETNTSDFWDIVPAQFHLMLTNVLGRQNRGIIIDRHTGHEVWNQPLVAYEIEPIKAEDYLGEHPEFPGIYRVNVTTTIWWANDNVGPDEISRPFELETMREVYDDGHFPGRRLAYELWLDAPAEFNEAGELIRSGDILVAGRGETYVGGVWKNGANPAYLAHTHPDYMWVPFARSRSSGYKNPRLDEVWIDSALLKR